MGAFIVSSDPSRLQSSHGHRRNTSRSMPPPEPPVVIPRGDYFNIEIHTTRAQAMIALLLAIDNGDDAGLGDLAPRAVSIIIDNIYDDLDKLAGLVVQLGGRE